MLTVATSAVDFPLMLMAVTFVLATNVAVPLCTPMVTGVVPGSFFVSVAASTEIAAKAIVTDSLPRFVVCMVLFPSFGA
jgi:hypothetical protein